MLTHALISVTQLRFQILSFSSSSCLLRYISRISTLVISPPELHRRRCLGRLLSSSAAWREVIGIDFGTINSRVAVMEKDGNPKMIELADRKRSMPSTVVFDKDGQAIVGSSSTDHENGNAYVYGIKKLIGLSYDYDYEQIQKLKKIIPYEIIPPDSDSEEDSEVWVKLANGNKYSATYITSLVIHKLIRETAKSRGNIYASHAVIGVPPSFDVGRGSALRVAAECHDSICVDLIDESLAASLYYATKISGGGRFAVINFGGGSFDISIVEASEGRGGWPNLKKAATGHEESLSGLEFDHAVMELLKQRMERKTYGDLSAYSAVLRREAERAKIELLSSSAAAAAFYSSDLGIGLERSELEDSMKGMILKVEDLCCRCLKEAKMRAEEVDEVILLGGMAGVPRLREAVEDIFGNRGSQDEDDEAVALGAAIKANYIANKVDYRLF